MSLLDVIVLCSLAGVCLGLPAITSGVRTLRATFQPRPAAPPAKPAAGGPEEWRQAWASNLISLLEDIETRGQGEFEKPEVAARLARELLWQIIGGDGAPPSSKK